MTRLESVKREEPNFLVRIQRDWLVLTVIGAIIGAGLVVGWRASAALASKADASDMQQVKEHVARIEGKVDALHLDFHTFAAESGHPIPLETEAPEQ